MLVNQIVFDYLSILGCLTQICLMYFHFTYFLYTISQHVISNRIHRKNYLVNANAFIINDQVILQKLSVWDLCMLKYFTSMKTFSQKGRCIKKRSVLLTAQLFFTNIVTCKFYSEKFFCVCLWMFKNILFNIHQA